MPAAHAVPVHAAALDRPVWLLNVPAGQLAHALRSVFEYLPEAQIAHATLPVVACVDHPVGQAKHPLTPSRSQESLVQ